ncbi:twin-arginine translocase TatA/TatE family subunit [Halopseudomonas salegens]|uniref:Sec-independent protein translocase protein TatA n=1 Tax=Halopseudomonas salegens TaxID=1434072 RepID=A0A1H2GBQ6_9GAMM|nr:twin-arginine translocase TatA/TatE family subunit [Halopseudomonas salegens]SDU17083.1 sec-independent protein translocase protein TatA [Halopseudomonas salegens]
MGTSGVSIGSLLMVLVIVMLLFGSRRLRTIGSDLGGVVHGFRSAVSDTEQPDASNRTSSEKQVSVLLKQQSR